MAAERGEPPRAHGRHPPVRGVAQPSRRRAKAFHGRAAPRPSRRHSKAFRLRCRTKDSHWRVGGRFRHHGRTCRRRGIRRNRIKASLSVFQRWKVKVLGFNVKARLRPQRIASGGCSDPFALVGTIGKACGEAWVCVFLGSPPGCWCVLPRCVGGVGVVCGLVCGWCWCVGVLVCGWCWWVGRAGWVVWLVRWCGSCGLLVLGTVLTTRRLDARCHVGVY